jgi:hypothetical protein
VLANNISKILLGHRGNVGSSDTLIQDALSYIFNGQGAAMRVEGYLESNTNDKRIKLKNGSTVFDSGTYLNGLSGNFCLTVEYLFTGRIKATLIAGDSFETEAYIARSLPPWSIETSGTTDNDIVVTKILVWSTNTAPVDITGDVFIAF